MRGVFADCRNASLPVSRVNWQNTLLTGQWIVPNGGHNYWPKRTEMPNRGIATQKQNIALILFKYLCEVLTE